jgi:hypothetical protein
VPCEHSAPFSALTRASKGHSAAVSAFAKLKLEQNVTWQKCTGTLESVCFHQTMKIHPRHFSVIELKCQCEYVPMREGTVPCLFLLVDEKSCSSYAAPLVQQESSRMQTI